MRTGFAARAIAAGALVAGCNSGTGTHVVATPGSIEATTTTSAVPTMTATTAAAPTTTTTGRKPNPAAPNTAPSTTATAPTTTAPDSSTTAADPTTSTTAEALSTTTTTAYRARQWVYVGVAQGAGSTNASKPFDLKGGQQRVHWSCSASPDPAYNGHTFPCSFKVKRADGYTEWSKSVPGTESGDQPFALQAGRYYLEATSFTTKTQFFMKMEELR
jgi:hypothetical protein